MADRRLLTVVAAAWALASSTACTLGPIYTHHVAGQIVDRKTRQPIAGAEVFMSYEVYDTLISGNYYADLRWTSTDQDGRFEFPGHWAFDFAGPFFATRSEPDLRWTHPQYGIDAISHGGHRERKPAYDWDKLELTMTRDELFINNVNSGGNLCIDDSMDCYRACQVWFGDAERCRRLRR